MLVSNKYITKDKHLEVSFYYRNQVDDKIVWGLGGGFFAFINILSLNIPPFSLVSKLSCLQNEICTFRSVSVRIALAFPSPMFCSFSSISTFPLVPIALAVSKSCLFYVLFHKWSILIRSQTLLKVRD